MNINLNKNCDFIPKCIIKCYNITRNDEIGNFKLKYATGGLDSSVVSIRKSLDWDTEKLFSGILEGIYYIIGVYKFDNALLIYRKAGNEFLIQLLI